MLPQDNEGAYANNNVQGSESDLRVQVGPAYATFVHWQVMELEGRNEPTQLEYWFFSHGHIAVTGNKHNNDREGVQT